MSAIAVSQQYHVRGTQIVFVNHREQPPLYNSTEEWCVSRESKIRGFVTDVFTTTLAPIYIVPIPQILEEILGDRVIVAGPAGERPADPAGLEERAPFVAPEDRARRSITGIAKDISQDGVPLTLLKTILSFPLHYLGLSGRERAGLSCIGFRPVSDRCQTSARPVY